MVLHNPTEFTFTQREPIALNVAQIVVEDHYLPARTSSNVEHLFFQAPNKVIHQWAVDRLQASGCAGIAYVIIDAAEVVETQLKSNQSWLKTMFMVHYPVRYDAHFVVRIEVENFDNQSTEKVAVSAHCSTTVYDETTTSQLEEVWYQLTADTMSHLDTALEHSIRDYMRYLVL
jgi:hypothetical protein